MQEMHNIAKNACKRIRFGHCLRPCVYFRLFYFQVRVPVKAQFLVDGRAGGPGLRFLDETVSISHFDDCKYQEEEDLVGRIAMGTCT